MGTGLSASCICGSPAIFHPASAPVTFSRRRGLVRSLCARKSTGGGGGGKNSLRPELLCRTLPHSPCESSRSETDVGGPPCGVHIYSWNVEIRGTRSRDRPDWSFPLHPSCSFASPRDERKSAVMLRHKKLDIVAVTAVSEAEIRVNRTSVINDPRRPAS